MHQSTSSVSEVRYDGAIKKLGTNLVADSYALLALEVHEHILVLHLYMVIWFFLSMPIKAQDGNR